jgi:hypothetical protein
VSETFRERWRYPNADPSIHLFSEAVTRFGLSLYRGAKVLELGCCENDFSKYLTATDVHLTGVDPRQPNPAEWFGDRFIQADAARADLFPEASFDAVVFLGSLEHFGLGYYGDPVNPEGDVLALANAARWVVPGGWVYYDVPWTPAEGFITDNRHYRVYDDAQIHARLTSTLVPQNRAYAHGESTIWQDARPTAPTSPFWYVIRHLRRPA